MNLFRADKMIMFKWILYSLFFVFCGTAMAQFATFEERMEKLMKISIIFIIGTGLSVIALSGLRDARIEIEEQ